MAASRLVVKVGSSSITDGDGHPSDQALGGIANELCTAADSGVQPVLVTSGAIASGRGAVTPPQRGDVAELQALAAVGQGLLMARYARLFADHGRTVGQVLFTARDFGERETYINARNTLERLLEWNVVPIVNENDTTATDEISLGDNDRLAALVGTMLKADLVVILTDTPGVFSADPRLSSEASLIEEVADVDAQLEAVAGEARSGIGRGGMASKVAAAKIASWSGVPCVIAGAAEPNVLARILSGESVGTRVRARTPALPARKVWIAFALQARGRLVVDDGAARALRSGGSSLLHVGVRRVEGEFVARDAVEIATTAGDLVAKGLARGHATMLRKVAGRRVDALDPGTEVEAVHRDDLVVLHG